MTDQGSQTELRTFLIADIRGYTTYTREHGDEAGARLAQTFASIVGEVVESHGGNLIELRGDEALVVFTSARDGLRAAVDLQDAIDSASLPRGVGIGMDAGEAVPVGEGYRGSALNLAARLCAQAKAGQILASDAVMHLAAVVEGIAYIDPQTLVLKGFERSVRAVEVVAADRVPTGLSHALRRLRLALRPHHRLVAVVTVVAVAAATFLLWPRPEVEPSLATLPAGLSLIDASSGDQLGFVRADRVSEPVAAIFADGYFWVLNESPISFVQIDPANGKVVREIASPAAKVGYFAVDDGNIWISDAESSKLYKVDIEIGQEVDVVDLAARPSERSTGSRGVTISDGSVWVIRAPLGELDRVDPATGQVEQRIQNVFGAGFLASEGDDAVWAAGGGGIYRIDTATNTATEVNVTASGPGGTETVAVGRGFGWVTNETKGELYKIDARGGVVSTFRTGLGARSVSIDGRTVWVANQDVGTITGVDALSGKTKTFRFGHPLEAAAAGEGKVLALMLPGRTFEDRIEALDGDVGRFFIQAYLLQDLDTALAMNDASFQLAAATCARLLSHPGAEAPEGWELQPEVAAAMPHLSNGGRTYTFEIKEGYAFSPPSNESITAETFQYSIERALSPDMGRQAPGPQFIDDIEGEEAFASGETPHISGLKADGDTLEITLNRPAPDFLERLSLPFFCPVPADTPVIPRGTVTDLPGGRAGVAGSGPFYVADTVSGEYTILKRNPNYPGPRTATLDAIALREGVDAGVAQDRIEAEGWDGILQSYDASLELGGQLDTEWGPDSDEAANGEQRYFRVPSPVVAYIGFDSRSEPFNDPALRRLVAQTMDRTTLAEPFRQIPTDQLLPPAMPGFEDLDLYPLTPAKPPTGHRNVDAFLGLFVGCEACRAQAVALAEQLESVGIDVRIEEFGSPEEAARAGVNMAELGTGLEFLDPASFLATMVFRDLPPLWVTPSVRRSVGRLMGLEGDERIRAANELANQLATKDVPVAAVGVGAVGVYLSPDLGCVVFPPLGYGLDLAGLCHD